jgi:hypothetical protein
MNSEKTHVDEGPHFFNTGANPHISSPGGLCLSGTIAILVTPLAQYVHDFDKDWIV